MANITAVQKKRQKKSRRYTHSCLLANLMSTQDKVGETIIKNGIGVHVDRCTLSWKSQHVFCKRKYCLENLLEIFERVRRHMDKADLIDIVYLDLDI